MSRFDVLPPYTRFEDVPPCYDADKALADFNALSSDEKKRLSKGVAQAASQDDAEVHFRQAASAAATAADGIDTMFISLTAKLNSLDDTAEFVATFTTIKENYRGVVSDSHELAINIAQYAESFDAIIVKFCADQSLTVERRKEKIQQFIDRGEEIKNSAKNMENKFTALTDSFGDFVGTFKTWAVKREEADEQKIKDIYEEIKELDKQINDINIAMIAIGTGLAVTLPATGILAALFPVAAPFIMGIGCALAGLEIASLTGLAIAKNILLNQKRQKESQITGLQDEISKIKATRTQLEERGQTDLMTFSTNIKAIAQVWTNVQNDALLIQKWLKDGASDADVPEYMKDSLEQGAKVYARMGQYLEDYANGVKRTVTRFKA